VSPAQDAASCFEIQTIPRSETYNPYVGVMSFLHACELTDLPFGGMPGKVKMSVTTSRRFVFRSFAAQNPFVVDVTASSLQAMV
jgi:hypothetical protein